MSDEIGASENENLHSGHPMIYHSLIKAVKMNKLYTSHMVVQEGENQGMFEREPLKNEGKGKIKSARNSMSTFRRRHLPKEPDRWMEIAGLNRSRGWYGWRWKKGLSLKYFTNNELQAIKQAEKRHARHQVRAAWIEAIRAKLRARKMLIGMALVTVLGIAAAQHYRPAEMWKVWREEGPSAFLTYLKDPRTNEEKFMQAWYLYDQGDLEEAKELVAPLLNLKSDAKTKADAYYLKGLIAAYNHAPETVDYLGRAVEVYEEQGAFNSQFNTYLSMADYVIKLGDLWLAETYIEKARALQASNPNLAYFHEVLSEFYLRTGNYEEALASIHKSLDIYQGKDISATARVLSDIGFLQVLLGQYEEGLNNSLASEKIVLEIGAINMYFYNQINFYIWAKCTGRYEKGFKNFILDRVRDIDDQVLFEKLIFAEEYACQTPPSFVGDDHPPPPPPDQSADGVPPPPPDGNTANPNDSSPTLESDEQPPLPPPDGLGDDNPPPPPDDQ